MSAAQPTGYGTDVWCADSLITGRRSRGAQTPLLACYRRLITPRGTLRGLDDSDEESAYGIDLAAYVGAVGYPTAVAALPGIVGEELRKDSRVADVRVDAFIDHGSDGLISIVLEVLVQLQDSGDTFPLNLRVTDVTVSILGGVG